MADAPRYAILGRGRWAGTIRGVLESAERWTIQLEGARRQPSETEAAYQSRLARALAASGAQIAWLCVPPGPHMAPMIQASIEAGLHVIVEKPWLCSPATTNALLSFAQERGGVVAIDYQYCFLEEVQQWRRDYGPGNEFRFGGRFTLSRTDRLGVYAMDELGSHLLAIRRHAVPQSSVAEIVCGYEMPDERRVWLEKASAQVASIDFLSHSEPIIQRFVAGFEAAATGAEFPFGLDFALRVASDADALRTRASFLTPS